jgi:hypothetical protein
MDDESVIVEIDDTTGILRLRDPQEVREEDGTHYGTVSFFTVADLTELAAAAVAAARDIVPRYYP